MKRTSGIHFRDKDQNVIPRSMPELERAVLSLLSKAGAKGMTCTEIGDALWGRPHRPRQSYARPAGKITANLKRKGMATLAHDPVEGRRHSRWFVWILTAEGTRKAA